MPCSEPLKECHISQFSQNSNMVGKKEIASFPRCVLHHLFIHHTFCDGILHSRVSLLETGNSGTCWLSFQESRSTIIFYWLQMYFFKQHYSVHFSRSSICIESVNKSNLWEQGAQPDDPLWYLSWHSDKKWDDHRMHHMDHMTFYLSFHACDWENQSG